MDDNIKETLDEWVEKINKPDFINTDPVQFPRRFLSSAFFLPDIEITAFIISSITWGKREMILRNAERILARFGDSPYNYIMNKEYDTLGYANIHRTFFEQDLAYMLRGFERIYSQHVSLQDFLKRSFKEPQNATAWDICRVLCKEIEAANCSANYKCFPCHFEFSALKRFNLALRWLVRNDGIVDLGVWNWMSPSQLYIPLDVHVGNVARRIGILHRKSNDRKAVELLTNRLREFCPEDPVKYDFALFGMGIGNKKENNKY